MSARYSEHSAEKRQNKPCEYTLNYPVGFPTPIFDLVDRNVAAGLAECTDGYD